LKKLEDILSGLDVLRIVGEEVKNIEGVTDDSRNAQTNGLFIAVNGITSDGHDYIDKAIEEGVTVVVLEKVCDHREGITYVYVKNTRLAKARIAKVFFEDPSRAFKLIGITGTNGKTTVSTLLFDLLKNMGYKVGLISTIECRINDEIIPSSHTTPDIIILNEIMGRMKKENCDYVMMEVSSHAIDQGRIEGLDFDCGVFTNITHDHLDYHGTFDNYIRTKKKFFDDLDKKAHAVTNVDDANGERMVQNTKAQIHTCSINRLADFKAKIISNDFSGLEMTLDNTSVHLGLVGRFNAYNLLMIYAVAACFIEEKEDILVGLSMLKSAEGRFDVLRESAGKYVIGIIDYAHTPDALENVLSTVKAIKKPGVKLTTVVGCGGDRDITKRPLMASIAQKYSDVTILTSDNPRTEDPEIILDEMEKGIDKKGNKVSRVEDRKEAIALAYKQAEMHEVIVVAGKGHEKYQDINGVKTPFDDKQILKLFFHKNI
jgi:UDP-N-acetylmuramoyl-L-alanyl-D-glutamate--2,6-diaminopimelate ligase